MQFIKQKISNAQEKFKDDLHEGFATASLYACWLTLVALLWADALLTGIWIF